MARTFQALGMSGETRRRVLMSDIRAYPYRILTLQTLTVSDKKQKSAMAVKMLEKIEKAPGFLNLLWVTSILTGRKTPRQMSSGGPPDPMK